MSSNAGIQELMQAETRASQIVAEARVGRGDRLKQAKQEVRSSSKTKRETLPMRAPVTTTVF